MSRVPANARLSAILRLFAHPGRLFGDAGGELRGRDGRRDAIR